MTALGDALLVAAGAAAALAVPWFVRREPVAMNDETRRRAPGSFVRLRHGGTHYQLDGPADGRVVVLVPGATLSLWIWDGLFERLVASGHRVLRYDLYGRGYSDRPHTRYGHDLFDDQLADLLAALDIHSEVDLVGLAFGCPIACQYALRHPGAVRGVTLMAPDGFGVTTSRGQWLITLPVVGGYLFQAVIGSAPLLRRLDGYSRDRELLAWLRHHYEPELAFRGFKRALASSIRNVPIHDSRAAYRRLGRADVPMQVLWGREDRITPLAQEQARQVFPRAEFVLFDGTGHLPHRERPDEVVERLSRFLSGGPAPAAGTSTGKDAA